MKLTNRHIFLLNVTFAVTAGSLLTGCDTLNAMFAADRVNYQNAESGPVLTVPADLTQLKPSQRFDISANPALLGEQKKAKQAALQAQPRLHVEYDGSAYWLVAADYTPEQLWPQLQALWEKNGFTLQVNQPELGVMETDWAENRAKVAHSAFRKSIGKFLEKIYSSGTRDKFRTLVQRNANGTAISIVHHGMEEVVIGRRDSSRWQDRAREPNLELAFFAQLMENLGLNEEQAQDLIKQARQTERATVTVNEQAKATLISLDESFERVWWRVGLALDRMDFAVEQRAKNKGLYVGRLIERRSEETQDEAMEENKALKKPGLLSKIFNRRAQKISESAPYLIRIQAVNNAKTQIAVITEGGQIDNTPEARRLILALHAQLN